MEERADLQLDVNQFCYILTCLTDNDLALFNRIALAPEPEPEPESSELKSEVATLLRQSTFKNGQLYNAYCARVLVTDPLLHIQNEIVRRWLVNSDP